MVRYDLYDHIKSLFWNSVIYESKKAPQGGIFSVETCRKWFKTPQKQSEIALFKKKMAKKKRDDGLKKMPKKPDDPTTRENQTTG